MEAIFMGAITWAIIGICYMIYSEFQGSDKMFNNRFGGSSKLILCLKSM